MLQNIRDEVFSLINEIYSEDTDLIRVVQEIRLNARSVYFHLQYNNSPHLAALTTHYIST